jgi:hypothetical protein
MIPDAINVVVTMLYEERSCFRLAAVLAAIIVGCLRLRNDASVNRQVQIYDMTFPAVHARYSAVSRRAYQGVRR